MEGTFNLKFVLFMKVNRYKNTLNMNRFSRDQLTMMTEFYISAQRYRRKDTRW
jgi:hypothetical protein